MKKYKTSYWSIMNWAQRTQVIISALTTVISLFVVFNWIFV